MAFLPSLQEAFQQHTGGVLFFRTEQNKSLELSVSSDLPIINQDSLGLGHSWGRTNTLGYSSLLESGTWETNTTSSTVPYKLLLSKISSDEELWKTWSSYALTAPGSLKKRQIGRRISTLITWQSQSKAREDYYRLFLDLQDVLVIGQIGEENSVLAAIYPQTDILRNWSNSITLYQDLLEAREVLEKSGVSTTNSSLPEFQPLEQLYDFRKPEEVSHFLEMNPFLVPLLRAAYPHIRKYFPSSKIFLQAVADPEAMDEEQLVVFIIVDHDPDKASEALNQLDKDWWLDAMERSQDKLCITLEFR
jgi:hypothetical protein